MYAPVNNTGTIIAANGTTNNNSTHYHTGRSHLYQVQSDFTGTIEGPDHYSTGSQLQYVKKKK